MKKIILPTPEKWSEILQRPALDYTGIAKTVSEIMKNVCDNGDEALIEYARRFDKAKLRSLAVTDKEISAANAKVPPPLKAAIATARKNIHTFHQSQLRTEKKITTAKGVVCWRENRAIETVGLYIPGGSAPLFSTVLMLAVPAKIAGCKNIVLCSPPDKNGNIHPAILYAASICGIRQIFKTGGAQAIAAMAYGTQTIPKSDKIFGPGSNYVTFAKQYVQQQGVAIDMPAGPSEVLIAADETCEPAFVAADLLSQAEHGPDSQVIIITWKKHLIEKVAKHVKEQLEELPRKSIAEMALQHSKLILVNNETEALNMINAYAPEHLILTLENEKYFAKRITNAGSVFIGNYTPESAGDYASGTNHTLPTNGYARMYSGVSVDSFLRKITFQKITKKGLRKLGPTIETMAEAEQLIAHKNAVSIRLTHQNKKP